MTSPPFDNQIAPPAPPAIGTQRTDSASFLCPSCGTHCFNPWAVAYDGAVGIAPAGFEVAACNCGYGCFQRTPGPAS